MNSCFLIFLSYGETWRIEGYQKVSVLFIFFHPIQDGFIDEGMSEHENLIYRLV